MLVNIKYVEDEDHEYNFIKLELCSLESSQIYDFLAVHLPLSVALAFYMTQMHLYAAKFG